MKAIPSFLRATWKVITKGFSRSSTAKKTQSIHDDDNLLRRVIFTDPSYVRPDQSLTSFAFTLRNISGVQEDGLSVDIERFTTYESSIGDRLKYRLYAVKASTVRSIELNCQHNPLPANYAHALIKGNITKGKSKRLALAAVRINYP